MESATLSLHVLAGATALAFGFLSLYSEKGRWLHRRSGRVFAYAMLLMATTGALMSVVFRPNRSVLVSALLTFYLVATGLLTVIRKLREAPRLHDTLFGLGFFATVAAWGFAFQALGLPGRALDQIPAAALFMFATVGTLGVVGDARLLRAGTIEGLPRLRRHLWRLNYALWIASSSFFYGQARQLPDWFKAAKLHHALVLLVLLTLVYWLVRLRQRRAPRAAALEANTAS